MEEDGPFESGSKDDTNESFSQIEVDMPEQRQSFPSIDDEELARESDAEMYAHHREVRVSIDDEDASSVAETDISVGVVDDVHSSMTITGATASHLKRELTSALEGRRTIRRLSITHAADCDQVRIFSYRSP